MEKVFRVDLKTGVGSKVEPVQCKNEKMELEDLLAWNHDLLPSDQMEPDEVEDPPRWLLVARQMPIPSAATGLDNDALDLLFIDQRAKLTLVECKTGVNREVRRQVVGQILDYAANGQFYWTPEDIKAKLLETHKTDDLDKLLRERLGSAIADADKFISSAITQLHEGTVRLVIFVDSAPWELKSIVEFLNRSLETIDLFLVEARHFEVDGIRLVAPTLSGYTESVRRKRREAKARATISAQGVSENADGPADEASFAAVYAKKHGGQIPAAAATILDFGRKPPFVFRWRIGQKRSALLTVPKIQSSNWFVLTDEGVLWPSFPYIPLKERASFAQRVCDLFAIRLPDDLDHKWPSIRESDWAPKVEPFLALTRELAEKLLAEKPVTAEGRER